MGLLPEILVIGAGVSGLTTAVRLTEAGYRVRVKAAEDPQQTTSCAAGAIWGPYQLREPRELRWSAETFGELAALARDGRSGVRMVEGREVARFEVPTPGWAAALRDVRTWTTATLPVGYKAGWSYTAPVVDMPVYLAFLLGRLRSAGGTLTIETVASLASTVTARTVVINCTGIGARALTGDESVLPARGELVVVENPGITHFFAEFDDTPTPTYFLPQGRNVVLGGSFDPSRDDREPDPSVAHSIRQRCGLIEPALATAKVIEHRVGLRPVRPTVRLEVESVGRGSVIHNYGHGGAGVTVSWGCAQEVLRLVQHL